MFFTGSLFFTAAGCGQFLQASQAGGLKQRDRGWWAALIQLAGTLFVVPGSGLPRNAMLVNIGTFAGALSFLVGAYLLLPRQTVTAGEATATAGPR